MKRLKKELIRSNDRFGFNPASFNKARFRKLIKGLRNLAFTPRYDQVLRPRDHLAFTPNMIRFSDPVIIRRQ